MVSLFIELTRGGISDDQTARFHCRAWRRGRMAAGGAGTAAGNADDRRFGCPIITRFIPRTNGLHRGLAEIGYVEGQNVAVQYHWGEGQVERTVTLAGELVRNRYALIVIFGSTPGRLP
jgi:hypothetical protein